MAFPIAPPLEPMLARPQAEIPRGEGWLYEPKWDGFRAIVHRDGDAVHIGSRNALPLHRYFPEVVERAKAALPERCVVDGEIVLPQPHGLDFEALQLRLHPADSRVRKLAKEMPAAYVAFDLLAEGDEDLRRRPLDERRARLVAALRASPDFFATPQTSDPKEAARWFERFEGAGLDGVIAKRADLLYVEGERVMAKIKHERTADCVVGGYRLAKDGKGVGSLLLGLYADDGGLWPVGFSSSFKARERAALLATLAPYEGGVGFGEGVVPGGQSRWSRGREEQPWVALDPTLVCEVAFDHMQGGHRFRHGARFLRWRPDKDPRACTFDQVKPPRAFKLSEIYRLAARSAG